MSRLRLPPLVLSLLLTGLALAQEAGADFIRADQPAPLPAPLTRVLDALETSRITQHLAFLTNPQQEGRGLGTRGLEATARYLAQHLQAAGLSPLGDTFIQTVPLREVRPAGGSIRLTTRSGTVTFWAGRNAVLPAITPGTLSGPVVFVGYGIQESQLGHDDFRDIDVRGKVVVFLDGCPPGEAWQTPGLNEKYASPRPADRYDSKLTLLEKLGAKAAIALEEGLDRRLAAGREPALPYFLAARGVPASGEPPLARVGLTADLHTLATARSTGTATLSIRGHMRELRSCNVLGKLDGFDPTLRREAVLLGAHMDHLGMPAGVLHPGADDNASGVAALLELARVLATNPVRPRRTLLVAFWTGEEEGKFGSGHYTRQPRWPLARTKAYLNLDMIGHPWTAPDLQTMVADAKGPKGFLEGLEPARFAEPGLSPAHPEFGPLLAEAGRGTGMSLHMDWTDGKSGGSDYRDFARLEVPFVRFFGSYFPDYHKPGDTLDKLDPEQVKRMTRLILATAWLLADR